MDLICFYNWVAAGRCLWPSSICRSDAENSGEVGELIPAKTTQLTFSWGLLSPCTGIDRGRVPKSEWH